MTASHIVVIVFILITAAFVVWLEVNSRKNAKQQQENLTKNDKSAESD